MNLNGRTINPGELRTPILLAPRTIATAAGGFGVPTPDTESQVSAWAKWTNAHGGEIWQAETAQAQAPATILIRYQASVDATWYVSKDDGASWYEIVGTPDDIGERHEYMEIKLKRYGSG